MSPRQPPLLTRLTALMAVALVLILGLLSSSPGLHAWLHANNQAGAHSEHEAPVGDADHECAVTLFSHGVEALLVFCLLMLARPLVRSVAWRAKDWLLVGRPRYWLVPSHAPPLA